MAMIEQSDVLIVGGGIGGLATALACARAGRQVRVLEQARAFSEVGAGLQIGPNGARALESLGVLGALDALSVFPSRIVMRDIKTGNELTRIDLGTAFQTQFGQRYRVMHRSDLLDALLAAAQQQANIRLETGRAVVDATMGEDSSVVHCADGSTFGGRVVIAADGLNSTLRPLMAGPDQPVCDGYVAYRGTVALADLPEHAGDDTVVLYTGGGKHLVQYPVRGGALYNQVAVFRSDKYHPSRDDQDWATSAELDATFADTLPYVKTSVARVDRSMRWPLRDRNPITTWVKGTTALIGDAAHPMYQYVAQGACQALEDAVTLGDYLGADLSAAALHRYADARRDRTARVQGAARWFGEFIHLDGMAASLRDALLKSHDPCDYSQMGWMWGWRRPDALETVKTLQEARL